MLHFNVLSKLNRLEVGQVLNVIRQCRKMSASSLSSIVDLRSDTVTHPTKEMRIAMMNAVVGDDVFGEDPTVIELQQVVAKRLGKEAALFVPTCTMANTISIMVHCEGRFNEVIIGSDSHIHHYEVAAVAQFGGIQGRTVANLPNGTMDLQEIEKNIRVTDDVHQPWTKLICLENTHNRCGGKAVSVEYIKSVRQLADRYNLKLHLDGARLFNAATALGVPVSEITAPAHSVSIAFTKGLSCPVGSMIVGSEVFISAAKRVRKAFGGGMRQVGVIASPALYAMNSMIDRLKEDHLRARKIAKFVDNIEINKVCEVDMEGVHSNIVLIEMTGKVTPDQFCKRVNQVTEQERKVLGESISVLMGPFTGRSVRYVTHNDISDDDVAKVMKKLEFVIEELSQQ